MKKTSTLATAILLASSYSTVNAESIWSDDSLGLIEHVSININDDVTGGCWTNMDYIKQSARLKLEQSGVNVYSEPLSSSNPFAYNINIFGNGMRKNASTCIGSLQLTISSLGYVKFDPSLEIGGSTLLFERGGVGYGPTLNKNFSELVEESLTELAADIISQRRDPTIAAAIDRHQDEYQGTPETAAEQAQQIEALRSRFSE